MATIYSLSDADARKQAERSDLSHSEQYRGYRMRYCQMASNQAENDAVNVQQICGWKVVTY